MLSVFIIYKTKKLPDKQGITIPCLSVISAVNFTNCISCYLLKILKISSNSVSKSHRLPLFSVPASDLDAGSVSLSPSKPVATTVTFISSS